MQDYIAAHIREPISLRDLALAAGYSQWYASRLFKTYTGLPPFEYLRRMRLSSAAVALCGDDRKIVDVAFDFVFDSHEGFTRAFYKQFGVLPKALRHREDPVRLFLPHSVRAYYLKMQKGEKIMCKERETKTVFVQVVDRPHRRLILKRAKTAEDYFAYCEEVGCDVWEQLCAVKEAMCEPAGMWLPASMIPPGTSRYVQGVEVPAEYTGPVPHGFEVTELPACKLLVFQGEPFPEEDFEQAIGDLWAVMEKYEPTVYGYEWADEDAPRIQLEPQGYRGYIEARPVRPVYLGK